MSEQADNVKNKKSYYAFGVTDYDEYWTRKSLDRAWWDRVREKEIIMEMAPPPKRALELGPGGGHLFWDMHKTGYDMHACDIAKAVLDNLKADPAKTRHRDLNDGFPDFGVKFDVIYGSMVLHHMNRPDLLIEQIREALNPGGIMVLTVPNMVTLRNRIRMLRGKLPKMSLSHRNFQTPGEVCKMIREKGFKEVSLHAHRKKAIRKLFPMLFATRVVVAARKPQ